MAGENGALYPVVELNVGTAFYTFEREIVFTRKYYQVFHTLN